MHDELLTIDELDANTRAIANDPRVTITALGESRLGRPIELISIGHGTRNALVVGVPHPNEPAGAVTVERMIAGLLDGSVPSFGFRWHFIKAIDPEGLALNGGWLKGPRTIRRYLENFFRPALSRQPETTFPLDMPGTHFDRSTPENLAWQRAFALTRPALHASLHHCDYGGGFFSLSRALPTVIAPLEEVLGTSGFGVHGLDGDVMTVDEWSKAISRYPSVPELVRNAKDAGASWANPWTVGEMSPGFGEARYGSLTLVPEAPLWDSAALHDDASSGITRKEQQRLLKMVTARVSEVATRYHEVFKTHALPPNAQECLWALAASIKMLPSTESPAEATSQTDEAILSRRQFETVHTRQILFALRTYGLLLSLANARLVVDPGCTLARAAAEEARQAVHLELAAIDADARLLPTPLAILTNFQMQAILACAQALSDA